VLTLAANSAITMELNRTNSATNDMIAAQAISAAGTLTVTNLGPGLVNGDKFKLFSVAVSGFSAVGLPAGPGNAYVWDDKLAVDGTIQLLSGGLNPIATNPTNITFSVGGGNLTLSWPADHTGWRLQSQTNALNLGLTTNWFDIAGSTATNEMILPVETANGAVFFRLVYP
jgi:hypothetical protein